MKRLIILGSISETGILQGIRNPEYDNFMSENRGNRICIELTIIDEKGTILQETYFRKVVLPCLQKGFRETGDDMTNEETYLNALSLCPGLDVVDGEDPLSKRQWNLLIEWAIRYCAINFQIIVPEPNKE